jgi:hypothetical protein
MRSIALLLLFSGCTTTIIPPLAEDPVPVIILDHGRHSSLVVTWKNHLYQYAYGDWIFYAQAQEGVIEASRALLWPSRAGLGRKVLDPPLTQNSLENQLSVHVDQLHILYVSRASVKKLIEELEDIFRRNIKDKIHNSSYDLVFVPHPEDYFLFNNSNVMLVKWLRTLGCRIEGWGIISSWKVKPAGSLQ